MPGRRLAPLALLGLFLAAACAEAADETKPIAPRRPDGNRLAYLDELNPYAPGLDFPKLVTPQWVGEPGVEAVVVLAIDDMRDPAKYEAYLRPILDRLKRIDGRAPVSIMTCQVAPDHPQLQAWLKEGLNLDVHTLAHPCPLLQKGDFQAARDTVDGCIDLLNKIPGNRPVAFRMPCCDSLNTPSPRFFSEIFGKTTPGGHFLSIDSSVFNILTPADPTLPRNLVVDPDGSERFRKYLPFKSFVNTIENYPYPYVIGGRCWEFPCVVPSDWEAQNLQKPNNPRTVADLKAALDAVVAKQGVFNLVFHPHGWIKPEQVVELIDHAVATHGPKVKFLNFREAQERLDTHLLAGQPLRAAKGDDNGVRVLDADNDGFMDVVIGNDALHQTRLWRPGPKTWATTAFPLTLARRKPQAIPAAFGVFDPSGAASVVQGRLGGTNNGGLLTLLIDTEVYHFRDGAWQPDPQRVRPGAKLPPLLTASNGCEAGLRLRDIDGDGRCEIIGTGPEPRIYALDEQLRPVEQPYALPKGARVINRVVMVGGPGPGGREEPQYGGLRFVDLDEDGALDLVWSNADGFGIALFDSPRTGWSRTILAGKPGDPGALPLIDRRNADGTTTENGFWVHSRSLWWQNEDTAALPDLVDRRSFNDLLRNVPAKGKSAEAARKALRVRPGFTVELMASEPLVLDPIAFDWSADGRLWVVEMGDYPLGVDGRGKPGGQVRVLTDDDGDGRYDRASVVIDGLGFPSGLMPWRDGVLVASAPDIFFAADRDGDGRAEVREVLFTGFHPGNQQHRLNGFELGLDGWVYGANGDSGGVVKSLKTGKSVNIRGRDYRFRPDRGEFEAESGMTQYGRHRDDYGCWFGNNNPSWGWVFLLSESELKRNPSFAAPDPRQMLEPDTRLYPVSPITPRFNDLWAAGRVTSANSPTPYRDDLFGQHFATSLFASDPVHNLVHRMVLSPAGPGLKGERAPGEADREFLASSDPWFRPTMLKTGPDGCLWVADMDRAVIEHPEWIPDDWEKRLDLRAGADRGRLFRVRPVDRPARPIPRLDRLDTTGLVAALDSPNGWIRDTAHRLLLHRNDLAAIEPLRALAARTNEPKTRVQALWLLENLGGLTAGPVAAALADPGPGVRRNAVDLAGRLLAAGSRPDDADAVRLADALLARVDDPSAEVRLRAALALGLWDDPRAGRALAAIARRDGADPWFRAAVLCSAPRHVGTLLPALFAGGTEPPPAGLVEPLFVLAGGPGGRAGLTALVEAISRPAGSDGRFAAWQFSALAGLIDAARRAGQPLGRWLGDGPGAAPLDRVAEAARTVAADASAGLDVRLAALSVFGRDPRHRDAERAVVSALLNPRTPEPLQRAAVDAVARGRDPKLPEALLAGWKGHSPALRSRVLDALLSRPEWTGGLLSSLEDTCVPPAEIDPAHRSALLALDNPELRRRARAVLGTTNGTRGAVVDRYREALAASDAPRGDRETGRAVFKRVCSTCHRLDGEGHEVGPDLAQLTDRSPEALLAAILDPNRAVESKYTSFNVQLVDGRSLVGLIASETAAALTLRRAEGKDDVVPRAEIDAMAGSGQSLMPEGLEKDIPPPDLAHLLAYLASGEPAPKVIDGNRPALIRPTADGGLNLAATAAEIRGPSLVFESPHGNLGYWQAAGDRATWRFEGVEPGRYEVWLEWACPPDGARQTLTLAAGADRLDVTIAPTRSWDDYRRARIGEIRLEQPSGRLDAFPAAPLKGPLLDLKRIELKPIRDGASCCEPLP